MEKGTIAMLTLLKAAKNAAILTKYVLFDSWFSSRSSLHAVKESGYDIIGMMKKTPKMLFRYNGENMPLIDITWIQAFQMLLQMFCTILNEYSELSDEKINELLDTFMNTIPAVLKLRLRTV